MKSKMKPSTTLHFDITERCNLNCIHCRVVDHGSYEITPEDARKIIRDTRQGFEITSFTIGGGEPLLREDCLEFARVFREEVPGATIGITSNGLLLDEEILKEMKGLIDSFQVSIDGSEPSVHDKIRNCEGSFDKAVHAIKACQDHEMPVSVRTTLMRCNLHDVSNILDKIQEWKVNHFGIRRILPQGNALKSWHELSPNPHEYIEVLQMIIDRIKNSDPKIHFWGGDPIMNIISFKDSVNRALGSQNIDMKTYFKNPDNHFQWYSGCAPGFAYLYITSNGDFCPCPMLPTPLGNVLKTSICEIVNNPIIQRIKIRSFKGKCGDCAAKFICGGCRASAFHSTGDILGEDPTCPLNYGYNLDLLSEGEVIDNCDKS